MKCFLQRFYLISGFFFIMLFAAQASHIVGGYATHTCLGGNKYKLSYTIYVECAPGKMVPPATDYVNIYSLSNCGTATYMQLIPAVSMIEYSPILLCPSLENDNTCNGGKNANFGVVRYETTVTLPAQCDDWVFQFVGGGQYDYTLTNVKKATEVPIYTIFNNTTGNCNASVVFEDIPPAYFTCVNNTYSFNTGAIDPDGDSLSYRIEPVVDPAKYISPWTGTMPISGLTIDSLTGKFTFTPNTVGKFLIGVNIDEYDRKTKTLKNSTIKQFEVIVQACTNLPPDPTTGKVTNLSTPAIKTGDYSISLSEGDSLSFDIPVSDPDNSNTVSFHTDLIQALLPGAQLSLSGKNPATLTVKWKAPAGSAGKTIYLPVTATDDACPMRAKTGFMYTIDITKQSSVTVASSDVTICKGASTTLTATGGTDFTWSVLTGDAISIPSNFSCNHCANPVASPSKTTTYLVTSNLSSNNKDTVIVTVNDPPVANAGNDVSICQGSTTNLAASGGGTYSWSPSTGLSSTTISNPVASPTLTTTYTVTVTSNGCSKSDSVIVIVNTLPVANAGANQSICSGESVQLGSAAVAGNSYNWTPTKDLTSPVIANPKASPTTTTTYTLTETITATGCTKSTPVTVTVNPSPVANAGKDTSLCNGTSITLAASGGGTYVWTPATGLSNPNIFNPVASFTGTKTYTLTVTQNGCSDSDTITVTIGAISANATASKSNICIGDTISLSASGGTSFVWTPAIDIDNSTSATPKVFPSVTTTYTVAVKDNNNCSATDSVKITVNKLPTVNAGADDTICKGTNTTKLNPITSHSAYSWSPTTGLSNVTIANPVLNPSSTITYTLTATDAGCSNKDSVTITVDSAYASIAAVSDICPGDSVSLSLSSNGNTFVWSPSSGLNNSSVQSPKASPSSTTTYTVTSTAANTCSASTSVTVKIVTTSTLTVSPTASSICSGDSVLLTAASSVAASYSWKPATGLSSTTTSTVNANPEVTTTYTVSATSNCGTDVDSVTITVNPMPSVSTLPDTFICNNNSLQLTTIASDATSFLWSPAQGLDNSTILSPVATPGETTTYIIDASNGLCHAFDSILVSVGAPIANFNANPKEGLAPLPVNFSNYSTGAIGYEWSFGETEGGSTDEKPSHVYSSEGVYAVKLIATSANGCTDDTSIFIKVNGSSALWIPNSFTPGEDGLNDIFFVKSTGITELSMMIFDRWGELIYEWDKVGGFWDGTYKGHDAPPGIYVYIVKAKGADNAVYQRTGHVTLLR